MNLLLYVIMNSINYQDNKNNKNNHTVQLYTFV